MLNQKYAEASVEVLDILDHMNANDLAKVSKKFINFLKENASKDYISNLDYSKKLNDIELKEETRGLIAIMYQSYWCSEEEKQNLQKKFYENSQKHQEELLKKYNPNDLFNKKQKRIMEPNVTETQLIEYKESFFQKILNKIKSFFRR